MDPGQTRIDPRTSPPADPKPTCPEGHPRPADARLCPAPHPFAFAARPAADPAYAARVVRPATSLLLLAALAGCTARNPSFDDPTTITVDPATGSTSTSTTPTTGAATLLPADTGGSAEAGQTTGPAPTTTLADTTAAIDDATTATTTLDLTTTADATTGEPGPEHLQLYDETRCNEPLWCYYIDQGVFAGYPAEAGSQACFTPATPPPVALTRVGYRIAASFGALGDARLLVQGHGPDGPGPEVLTLALGPEQRTPGAHAIVFDAPILLPGPGFCLGLIGGGTQPSGGLGVAVDPDALVPGQSFFSLDGPQGCNHAAWTDITNIDPTPKGAWCIDADVVPAD